MNITELKEALKKAERQLAAAGDASEKDFAQKKIDKLKTQISDAEKSESEPSKKKAKAPRKPREAKPKKAAVSITYNGKTYNSNDPDFCKIAKKQLAERLAARKKNEGKFKTKSVSTKIGDDIADAVSKALHNIETADIKNNPKQYFAKFTHLSKAANSFFSAIREILGDDYNKDQIRKPLEAIERDIKQLTEKYKRKK